MSPGIAGAPDKPRSTDLGIRTLSAAVLIPAVLALVWFGGLAFACLMAAGAAVLVVEWNGICRSRGLDAATAVGAAAAAGAALAAFAGYPLMAAGLIVVGAAGSQALAGASDPARLAWLGVPYAGLPATALVVLRADAGLGFAAVGCTLVLVWATDIGGYVFGRLVGGPKLAPRISPGKTWAGFLGGLLAAAAAVWIASRLTAPAHMPLAVVVLVSIASQAGDLGESLLKRRFGVKDSSRLIPGHGGLMDRVDGLVAASVLAAGIGISRGGLDAAGAGLLLW